MQRQLEANSFQGFNDNKDKVSGEIASDVKVKANIKVTRILCGGVAKTILPYLENDYDYQENLIMLGLKKIKETESNYD